ncbi:MAG TPA: hypothetical protein VN577_03820 [Terriglobales bacterium]|nr:hypothetical protein [Terriglobales bacterium]
MRIYFPSPFRKAAFVGSCAFLSLVMVLLSFREAAAWYVSRDGSVKGYRKAVRLTSYDAKYHYFLGELSLHEDPAAAKAHLQRTLQLDSGSAEAWLAIADAEARLHNPTAQNAAILAALSNAPRDIRVQWQAANLFLVQGELLKALPLMREIVANDPDRRESVLALMYRLFDGNVDSMMEGIPATAKSQLYLMEWLIGRDHAALADQVWPSVMGSREKLLWQDTRFYVDSLIARRDIAKAREVWTVVGRADPSVSAKVEPGNLLVNGDFESNLLNAGFDWRVNNQTGINIAVDTSAFHGGTRSIAIQLDAGSFADAGLYQLVPVKPDTKYVLRGFWHGEELESANGLRFAAIDDDSSTTLALSDGALGSFPWREASVEFTTGPKTQLVRITLVRSPETGRIRGTLWIDEVRLESR